MQQHGPADCNEDDSSEECRVREDHIRELVRIGIEAGHRHEQVPYESAAAMVLDGNVALLALFIGTGNWGVSDVPEGLPDPAGENWEGRPGGLGKHLTDNDQGGLGIAHFDSANLIRFYGEYGRPAGIPDSVLDSMDFNQIQGSEHAGAWNQWAESLLENVEFQIFLVNYWIEHFWEPSLSQNPDEARAIINVRLRNSVPRLADRAAADSIEDQIDAYVAYKTQTRGERAGRRARRQGNYARRVIDLRQWVLTHDNPESGPP